MLRSDGNYDGAAARLRIVLSQYPRDRVALNDLGRILFLQRKYQEAVKTLQSVLAIDPEDLQAHYNLMLCYNGLGNEKLAKEHESRYLRFKADESSQAITGPYRQLHPEDNNERQAVHEHVSVPLPALDDAPCREGRPSTGSEEARVCPAAQRPACCYHCVRWSLTMMRASRRLLFVSVSLCLLASAVCKEPCSTNPFPRHHEASWNPFHP